jgi:hypothetical protein
MARLCDVSRTIRPFTEADWPVIWPVIAAVCREGETYTYPVDISEAVGTVLGAFRSPKYGYTGLHVMYLPLVDA